MKKTYSDACSSSYECNNSANLICPLLTGTCNCPILSASIFCDCPRSISNETYWNGTACQPAASFNETCSNATSSYMCQSLTQGTICNGSGSTYYCQCPFMQYFDIMTNKCQNQVSFNQSCFSDDMCLQVLGLSCFSTKCEWVGSFLFG